MQIPILRLGTRASKLALWQAEAVKKMLETQGLQVELVKIETKGDKVLDRSFSKIGSKGLFTEELEEQLLSGQLHLVQHSAKDVQSTLPLGLELIAFCERELPADVLIANRKELILNPMASFTVGTSSTRRVAMLRHYYPNIKTVDMRGNLQTRFQKLDNGQADAMLLAYAGVQRMGYANNIVQTLDTEVFVPAVGQGSVAIEIASTLPQAIKESIRKACNHAPTEQLILAERAYLKAMEGGCSVPIFALAKALENQISLTGGIISLDGKELLQESITGSQPEQLGLELAQVIKQKGGDTILSEIKKQLYN
jgi:hydroxymethylbilane synthase